MIDPFSEIISLLRPQASFSKRVHASGPFRVCRDNVNEAFYCAVLSGRASLEVDGKEPLELDVGDFVLIPAAKSFTFSSLNPPPPEGLLSLPIEGKDGIYWLGPTEVEPEVRQLIGHCTFASPDADLLMSLLPDLVVVHGEGRLTALMDLLREEFRADRPARNAIVEHLLQVLLIEAFRSSSPPKASFGLLNGLADKRIGPSLRSMHATPDYAWTVPELANKAGLSRSAFFTRFSRVVGLAPMGYLQNWRMTIAKHMLCAGLMSIAEVSSRTGYGSSSAFSTAFSRHVGTSPAQFAKSISAKGSNALLSEVDTKQNSFIS